MFTDPAYLLKFNYLLPSQFVRFNPKAELGCPFDPRLPIGFVTKALLTPQVARLKACMLHTHNGSDPLYAKLVYKGRPLQGTWATAPYLHNGSVPTLYALLQAPGDRPKTFCVGSRKFDPKQVGFAYRAGAPCPSGTYAFDVRGFGNSNSGQDYGAAKLTDHQRYALIEFMKTL